MGPGFFAAASQGGGGGVGSYAAKGAALGSVIPGLGTGIGLLAGGALGALKGLFGNKARKNEAENNRLLMQHGIDTRNLSRKRKASLVGSLLRTFTAHPETYGKFVSNDMFGYMPGPLTEQDYIDPAAPKFKAQSNLSAMLGGALGGAGAFLDDPDAAEADVMARIRGAGQPVGRG